MEKDRDISSKDRRAMPSLATHGETPVENWRSGKAGEHKHPDRKWSGRSP